MVYVDNYNAKYGRMIMCHLTADNLEELFKMVDKIGVNRKWFQRTRFPHFDICLAKKELAIKNGAVEVTPKEIVKIAKQLIERENE
jgi:Protein of unknown function (DUF4031)